MQMLGSYMPVIGSVGSSRRNNDRPGTAVSKRSDVSVHRAMLFFKASSTTSMLLVSISCITTSFRVELP